jgi:hypothetical protein
MNNSALRAVKKLYIRLCVARDTCSIATKDEEDTWYNLLSDSEDKDDNSIILSLTLPPIATSTAFTMPNIIRKEYSTSTRIKAIYILE